MALSSIGWAIRLSLQHLLFVIFSSMITGTEVLTLAT
jgi:hypothetical protein